MRDIPLHRDYVPDKPAAQKRRQGQFGFSREAERSVTIDLPQPDMEGEDVSAAEGFAGDVKWSEFMRVGGEDRFDKIIGIFKDEPLMAALMERIHEDRRLEAEAETAQ